MQCLQKRASQPRIDVPTGSGESDTADKSKTENGKKGSSFDDLLGLSLQDPPQPVGENPFQSSPWGPPPPTTAAAAPQATPTNSINPFQSPSSSLDNNLTDPWAASPNATGERMSHDCHMTVTCQSHVYIHMCNYNYCLQHALCVLHALLVYMYIPQKKNSLWNFNGDQIRSLWL